MSSLSIESLNYMTVGSTESIFCIDVNTCTFQNGVVGNGIKNCFFVAGIDEDSDFGVGRSNKFSIQTTTSDIRIYPIYDMQDVCIKSSIKKIKNSQSEYKNNSEDYVDIYVPQLSSGIINACQMENYAYILTDRIERGPYMRMTDLLENRKQSSSSNGDGYTFQIQSSKLHTHLYNTSADMTESDGAEISNHYKINVNVSGIKYNYMVEIPQNLPQGTYNDFDSGDIMGDMFQGKNVYDCTYSMNMSDASSICETRDYIGIDRCGKQLFMKFYDNIDYDFDSTRSYDLNSYVESNATERDVEGYPFQKIEVIYSVNRWRSNIRHKSGLYSITVENTGLGMLDKNTELRDKIMKDIKNNITDVCQKLSPAHTQLFDVFFK